MTAIASSALPIKSSPSSHTRYNIRCDELSSALKRPSVQIPTSPSTLRGKLTSEIEDKQRSLQRIKDAASISLSEVPLVQKAFNEAKVAAIETVQKEIARLEKVLADLDRTEAL